MVKFTTIKCYTSNLRWKHTIDLSVKACLFAFIFTLLLFPNQASAQTTSTDLTSCYGGCTSGDFFIKIAFLSDINGKPLTGNECIGDADGIIDAYLSFTFTNTTRSDRNGMFLSGTLNGEYIATCFSGLLPKKSETTFTYKTPIKWKCGSDLTLKGTFIGWGSAGEDVCSITCDQATPSKCRNVGDQVIVTPCSFSATCPDNTSLGIYDCTTQSTIPAKPSSVADLSAPPYYITIGSKPCGTIRFTCVDNGTPNKCSTSDQTITRTITIYEDKNGNNQLDNLEPSKTCTFSYVFKADKSVPTLKAGKSVPQGQTSLQCLANVPAAVPVADIAALYEDGCGGNINVSLNTTPTGNNCDGWSVEYKYTIKDDCGNTTNALITHSGKDTEAPKLKAGKSVPQGQTGLQCLANVPAAALEADIAALFADNCGGSVTAVLTKVETGNNCDGWTVEYKYAVKDACGNETPASIKYSGKDTEAPKLKSGSSIPSGQTGLQCLANVPSAASASTIAALFEDNCSTVSAELTDTKKTGDNCLGWSVEYVYTIKDVCGNSTTASIIHSGKDTEAPTFTRPKDITINSDATCAFNVTPATTGDVTNENDNCSIGLQATYKDADPVTGSCPGEKIIKRTWSLKDECQNAAADQVQTITIKDVIAPVFTSCAPDIMIDCNASTNPVNTGKPVATDNCGTVNLNFEDVTTTKNCFTLITRTWTADDGCGNTATCVQHITVRDQTAPTLTCPADKTLACNESSNPTNTGLATATDFCTAQADITIFYTDAPAAGSTCTGKTNITRTWTAIDGSGNTKTCVQKISFTAASLTNEQMRTDNSKASVATKSTAAVSKNTESMPGELKVQAYPNPYFSSISFQFTSPTKGQATLEVHDLMGRRLAIAYQGLVEAGVPVSFTYNIPSTQRVPLIYKLSVGENSARGKLLPDVSGSRNDP